MSGERSAIDESRRKLLAMAPFLPGRSARDNGGKKTEMICEAASRIVNADLTALYRFPKKQGKATWLTLAAQRGEHAIPGRIPAGEAHIEILSEHGKAVVQLSPDGPFPQLLLQPQMSSAIAVYVEPFSGERAILLSNSRKALHFNGRHIELFEELSTLIHAYRGGING